jgi:quinol monooxygenase YgiN
MRFARNVQFQLKNGKEAEFKRVFENDVLPILKKEHGFQDELTLVNRNRAIGISLWDNKDSAEKYHTATYPQILEKLSPVIEGTPNVETYEVSATTLRA